MSLLDEPMPRDVDLEHDAIAAEDANVEIQAEMTEAEARSLLRFCCPPSFGAVIMAISVLLRLSEQDLDILSRLWSACELVGQAAVDAVNELRFTTTPAVHNLLMAARYQASAGYALTDHPTPWALARLRDALDALSDRNPLPDPR